MSADRQRDGSDRLRGRQGQARRLRLWSADPFCAKCDRLTDYPHGFEVDHIVPLHQGGADDDSNLQLLCVHRTGPGRKFGCHEDKTRADLGQAVKRQVGGDGWPVGGDFGQ